MNDELCPCGSTLNYRSCCEQYISNKEAAPTPEALMRSRYVAYTKAEITYIEATSGEGALRDFSFADSQRWSEQAEWMGLEVLQAPTAEGDSGFVEFKVEYAISGVKKCLYECSEFKRIEGSWYYIGSKKIRTIDQKQQQKTGRNDPCPCGSGKKYKKCCANS
jgi:SEC-C motif domain protein